MKTQEKRTLLTPPHYLLPRGIKTGNGLLRQQCDNNHEPLGGPTAKTSKNNQCYSNANGIDSSTPPQSKTARTTVCERTVLRQKIKRTWCLPWLSHIVATPTMQLNTLVLLDHGWKVCQHAHKEFDHKMNQKRLYRNLVEHDERRERNSQLEDRARRNMWKPNMICFTFQSCDSLVTCSVAKWCFHQKTSKSLKIPCSWPRHLEVTQWQVFVNEKNFYVHPSQ